MKAHLLVYTYSERKLVPGVYALTVTQERDEEVDMEESQFESYVVDGKVTRIVRREEEYVNNLPAARPLVAPARIVAVYVGKEEQNTNVESQQNAQGPQGVEAVQQPQVQGNVDVSEIINRIGEKKITLEKVDLSGEEVIAYGFNVKAEEMEAPFVIVEFADGRTLTLTKSEFSGQKAVKVSPLEELKEKRKKRKSKKSKKSSKKKNAGKAKKRSRKSKAKSASA
jgi:hypothetical protein